jgi:DNA-binding CsgD family transcriptional regulator
MSQNRDQATDLNARITHALAANGIAQVELDSHGSFVALIDQAIAGEEERIAQKMNGSAPELASRIGTLRTLQALRRDAADNDFRRRLRTFSRVPAALNRLRALGSPEAVVRAAPAEVATACDLDRVVVFRIDGSFLVAESVFVRGDRAQADDLLRISRAQPTPLADRILETEIMRRRVAMFVHDAMNHPLTYKPLMELYEMYSYVAAPIMPSGRVIGFIHGDRGVRRPGHPAAVDDVDREILWSFAVGIGYVLERAELVRRLHAQASHVRDLMVDAEAAAAAYLDVDIELVATPSDGQGQAAAGVAAEHGTVSTAARPDVPESFGEHSLTRREHEVLALLADGATNAQIAAKLFITEGTAKSHVGRILRKLGAGNRVEAVSIFLRGRRQDSASIEMRNAT